jgi:hypothetical protein
MAKQVIEYRQGRHNMATAGIASLLPLLQNVVDKMNTATGQSIDSETLQMLIPSNHNQIWQNHVSETLIKDMIFAIISKEQGAQTLFGMAVNPDKAKELIQYPDLTEINAAISALPETLPELAKKEDIVINEGNVTTKAGFAQTYKDRFTLYATTVEQLARLALAERLVTLGNDLNAAKGAQINDRFITTGIVTFNRDTKEYAINTKWVEVGYFAYV